jgi:hypothetical protein
LTRKSKNEFINYSKFEKLDTVTQNQLRVQSSKNESEMKNYYSVPKLTKQLFWNMKVSQEQDGKGFLATDGLIGLKPIEGAPKPDKTQMNREY